MKLLFEFDQRHPTLGAIVGSASGLASWFIAHSPDITNVAGAIGAIATAGIAVFSLLRILYRGAACAAAAIRQRLRNRAQRRAWKRNDPAHDHLNFGGE